MLNEKEILNLLKGALENYIKYLDMNNSDFMEYKGQIIAYINILNREDLKIRYLDINKAKELLNKM